MALTTLYDTVVTVQYVQETVTQGGLRRFLIGAEKLTGDSLGERLISFSTLSEWKASLCDQAKKGGLRLHVKYRLTRWFDADLLFVEVAKDAEVQA